MKMLQKDFRDIFLDNILGFLWRQWSAIGVLGEARAREPWVIDPEALLVFTLETGRYDPRLFDEVMDWLVTNGHLIDMQRLRGILRKRGDEALHRLRRAAAPENDALPRVRHEPGHGHGAQEPPPRRD